MNLAEEITMLRKHVKDQDKESRRLKEENEFLEEASAYFAASETGVRTFSWTGYAARPRFCRYSQGLIFPSDVLILFVLYHSKYSLKMSINSDILTPVQS